MVKHIQRTVRPNDDVNLPDADSDSGLTNLSNGVSSATDKRDALQVIDKRTGQSYEIPIKNNAVRALDFETIRIPSADSKAKLADELEGGLRILDPGYQNTAVKESKITFVYVMGTDMFSYPRESYLLISSP